MRGEGGRVREESCGEGGRVGGRGLCMGRAGGNQASVYTIATGSFLFKRLVS